MKAINYKTIAILSLLVFVFLLGFSFSVQAYRISQQELNNLVSQYLRENYGVNSIEEYRAKLEQEAWLNISRQMEALASEYPEINFSEWRIPDIYRQYGTSSYQPPKITPQQPFYMAIFSEPVTALQVFSLSGLGLIGLAAVPPIRKNKRLKQALALSVVALCVFSIGYFVGLTAAQTGTITIEPNSFQTEASYIIFTDGTTIKARNGKTGAIDFSGTDARTVIQSALNALTPNRTWKEKVVCKGDFILTDTLWVPSYTVLEIQGRLKLADNTNKTLIVNSEALTSKGNTEIEIFGGVIDGNSPNQSPPTNADWSPWKGFGISMWNVTRVSFHDILFRNMRYWCLYLNGAEDVALNNLLFDTGAVYSGDTGTLGAYQDGIRLHITKRVVADGLYGVSGDDFLGISVDSGYESSEMTITNVAGKSRIGALLRLRVDGTLKDVVIRNLATKETASKGIRISRGSGGVIQNIAIEGFSIEGWGSVTEGPAIYMEDGSGIDRLKLSGIIGSPATTGTFSSFTGKFSARLLGLTNSEVNLIVYDVKDGGRGVQISDSSNLKLTVVGDYVNTGKTSLQEFIELNNVTDSLVEVRIEGGKRGVWLRGTSLRNKITGIMHGQTLNSVIETDSSDYNIIEGCEVDKPITKVGANTIVRGNVGYDTENFKATGVSISVGTGGAYGSATAITTPSGRVAYPRVKITWGGTFGTDETVTVKVEAVYTDGTTAYVEKSATAVGSLWLTDDDVASLVTQGKDIVKLNVYAKSSAASTTVTVTVDAYGKA